MSQIPGIYRALKGLLKAKGYHYQALCEVLGLSEASVKRSMASESFTLQNLEKICQFLQISFEDLMKLARNKKVEDHRFSWDDELHFTEHPKDFVIMYLLAARWEVSKIKKHYDFNDDYLKKACARLDRMGLVERFPGGKVRTKIFLPLAFISGGPIEQMYREQIKNHLLEKGVCNKEDELEEFLSFELSQTSFEYVKRKFSHLLGEVKNLARIEANRPKEETRSVGMIVAIKPWVLETFKIHQKKKM